VQLVPPVCDRNFCMQICAKSEAPHRNYIFDYNEMLLTIGLLDWAGPIFMADSSTSRDDVAKHAFCIAMMSLLWPHVGLKNWNSTARQQQSAWEMIANIWNDLLFAPQMEDIPDLHQDFLASDFRQIGA
jgi:hypothetical protein